MNLLREIEGICLLEWRRLRSSARVLILALLYVLSAGLLISLLGVLAHSFQDQLKAAGDGPGMAEVAAKARVSFLGFLFENAKPEDLERLAHIPIVVFLGFRASLFFVPIWVALLGFDAVSEELSTRSIRYVTLRARRTSIVLGKYLALACVLAFLLLLLTAGLLLYARRFDADFTGKLWVFTLLRLWAAGSLFALGYLGLTFVCSTWVRSPSLALALNLVALFGFWILNSIGERAHAHAEEAESSVSRVWGYLRFASPSHYGPALLHPVPSQALWGGVAFLVFILLSLAGSAFIMERRDV